MKNIYAIIGSNWGDEGKGLFTDYFCNDKIHTVLNIRYNGTSQASHTVVIDEKRRVFHGLGAGSYHCNVDTYFSEKFVINPIVLKKEIVSFKGEINRVPLIYINENCRITTIYDVLVNQWLEQYRSQSKHGSCGMGFFETISRYDNCPYFISITENLENLQYKLEQIRSYLYNKLKKLKIELTSEQTKLFFSNDILYAYIEDFLWIRKYCRTTHDKILEFYDKIVFEGAQGLALCEDNLKYFPHLTPSETGMKYINDILINCNFKFNLQIIYITRSYFTRHGNGPFPTECKKELLGKSIIEKTNMQNQYQGNFRFGYFDKKELSENIKNDLKKINTNISYSYYLGITHLDETDNKIKDKDGDITNYWDLKQDYLYDIKGFFLSNSEESKNIYLYN